MTMISSRPFRTGAALLGLSLLTGLTACAGGTGTASTEEVSARLAIISTNIETAAGSGSFEPATEGQSLVVGDKVKTDPTGFAELTYHDGSWMRIEQSATLTIDELTDNGDTDTVKTSIDIGKSWNRVEELTEPDDAYEVETPVGTAAVRGTQFATDCATATECTFSVVDGTVIVTPTTGSLVTLTAGQQITITADTPPSPPDESGVAAISADPFIAKNLELDTTKQAQPGGTATTDTSGDAQDEGAAATGDLDPSTIDACSLLTAAEVQVILQANPETARVTSVETGAPSGNGCNWWASWDTDFGSEGGALDITPVRSQANYPEDYCLVVHRGICLSIGIQYWDGGITVPPEIDAAIRSRLDG